ncbi:MAG: PAS domain S-box protein [Methanoregula sp.]|nr:MAG: PAS domain S-box protein [Methanoregula sp.]
MENTKEPGIRDESFVGIWFFIIVNTTILSILVNIFSLSFGMTEVTPGLFFIPVVITAYWYPKKGMLFAFLVTAIYLLMIYVLMGGSTPDLVTGLFKAIIMIGVAAVVSSLALNLQKSEAKYRGIFNNSEAGTGLIDANTLSIIEANQRFASILGYSMQEIRDVPFSVLWVDASQREGFFALVKEEGVENFETRFTAKTSDIRWVLLAAGMLPDNQMVCTMVDITQRKQMEAAQRTALKQIEKNIEQFAILGDHIRNPLAVIVGLTCMLAEDVANKVLAQAKEIDRIITQIDIGWIESDKVRNIIKKYYGIGADDILETEADPGPVAGTDPVTK